eukprot:COSAG05_NODE_4309_length_1570_cov_3.063902_1_plen_37_part_10
MYTNAPRAHPTRKLNQFLEPPRPPCSFVNVLARCMYT